MIIKILFLSPVYIWAFILTKDALARPAQENAQVVGISPSHIVHEDVVRKLRTVKEAGDDFKALMNRGKRDASNEHLDTASDGEDLENQVDEDNSILDNDDGVQTRTAPDISTTPDVVHQEALSLDRGPVNSDDNEHLDFQQESQMMPDLDTDTEFESIGGDGILLESTLPPPAVDQREHTSELDNIHHDGGETDGIDTRSIDGQSDSFLDGESIGEDNTNSDQDSDMSNEFIPSDRDNTPALTDSISDESDGVSNSTLNDRVNSNPDQTDESSSQTGMADENTNSQISNAQQTGNIHHIDGSSSLSDHHADSDLVAEDTKIDELKSNHSEGAENYTSSAQERTATISNSSSEHDAIATNISNSQPDRHVTSSLNAVSSESDSTARNDIIYNTLPMPTRPANLQRQSIPTTTIGQSSAVSNGQTDVPFIPLRDGSRDATVEPERPDSIDESTTTTTTTTSSSSSPSTTTSTTLNRNTLRSTQTITNLPTGNIAAETRSQSTTTESTPGTSLQSRPTEIGSRSSLTTTATTITTVSTETPTTPNSPLQSRATEIEGRSSSAVATTTTTTTTVSSETLIPILTAATTRSSTEPLRTPPSTSTTPFRADASETETPTTTANDVSSEENKNVPATSTSSSAAAAASSSSTASSTLTNPTASTATTISGLDSSTTNPARLPPNVPTAPTRAPPPPVTPAVVPQQSSETPTAQSISDTTTAVTLEPTDYSQTPLSFVEFRLDMNWTDFCTFQATIRQELVEILSGEAGEMEITNDQIQFFNLPEDKCRTPLLNVEEEEDLVLQMIVVNKLHHYDECLTNKSAEALRILKTRLEPSTSNILQSRLLGAELLTKTVSIPISGDLRPGDGGTSPQNPEESGGGTVGDGGGNVRYSKTKSSNPFSDPGVVAAVVLASIGIFVCLAVVALQVAVRRRNHLRTALKRTIQRSMSVTSADSIQLGEVTKSRPNSGLFNPALDISDSLEPTHQMNLSQLANFCYDESKVLLEFEKLPNRMPRLSVVPTGEEDKNRFANVLPLTLTRVKLFQDGPDPRSSYINANYITGPDNQCQYYIATQAPTEDTVADFWTMVWQQGTKAIVMLTQMEEDGQNKCTPYWPDFIGKSAAQKHGDFLIELKNKDVCQEYIASELQINHLRKIESRPIFHFWYTCWPSKSLPEPISLVKLVLDSRTKYEDGGTPLVVHCSPGTGRTGTFIALDLCMHQFETRRTVDVMKTVYSLRQERAGAVQSKEQYNLLYQAAREYASIIESPGISAASSATTLHALLPSS